MSPIKVLLIIPLLVVVILFVLQLRNQTFYRSIFILFAIIGIVFVIDPELTNSLAHRLNVSRGADLMFYFCVMTGFCSLLVFYSKLRRIESIQTQIIREQAIESARKGTA